MTDEASGFNRNRFTKHEIDSPSRISLKAVVLNLNGEDISFVQFKGIYKGKRDVNE